MRSEDGGVSLGGYVVWRTSSEGLMRLLSRMALSTAEPNLPVALVRANFPMVYMKLQNGV
jgi:hypothetical protein